MPPRCFCIFVGSLILLLLSEQSSCYAQTRYREVWASRLGGSGDDRVYAATVDAQGFPIVSGMTGSSLDGPGAGLYDAYVRKLEPSGATLWTQQFGTAQNDSSRAVAVDGAGNVFVSGSTSGLLGDASFGGSDFFLAKLDPQGDPLWTRQFGSALSDQALSLAIDANGNAYVAGYQDVLVAGKHSTDGVLAKFAPDGSPLWSRTFGSNSFDYAESIALDAAGHIYVAGSTLGAIGQPNLGSFDAYLRKYDPGGNVIWTQQFGTASSDRGYAVDVDGEGLVYVAGNTSGNFAKPVSGGSDIYLAKFDQAGGRAWTRQFGGSPSEQARAIALDAAGNINVAGEAGDAAYLWSFDASGEYQWLNLVTSTDNLGGYAVATHEGAVYFGGLIRGGALTPQLGSYDGFLVKYAAPADFNADAVIDGADFLAWQQGQSPIPLSAYDLLEWKSRVVQSDLVAALPEPCVWLQCAAAQGGVLLVRRRRRRQDALSHQLN